MTLAEDFEEEAGEPILFAVIGDMGWSNYGNDERHDPGLGRKGHLLDWGAARPLLDYNYSSDYGAPDCQAVYAWTESKVLFVVQYDGSTWVSSLPRNPFGCVPTMPGG